MNEAARYSIGPLAMAIEAEVLRAFADEAPAGAKIVYATGVVAPQKAEAFVLAGELARAGRVRLHNPRSSGGGFDWIAVKLDPAPANDDPAPSAALRPGLSLESRVLRAFTLAAKAGQVCPTNAELAGMLGLPDPDAASYRVRKLVAAGAIKVIDNGPRFRRIVTIVETGHSTVEGRL